MATGQVQHHRKTRLDPHRAPQLARFPRHRDGRQQHQNADGGPHHVEQHDAGLDIEQIIPEDPHQPPHHRRHQQAKHEQMGTHRLTVEVALLQQSALFGDIELAPTRAEQSHQGRLEQVKGQHAFVDLAPEGVAEAPHQPRVGVDRVKQMRQSVDGDHLRRRGNDVQIKQQVGQGCGQEHQARHGELEMQHGVEVAKPLRQAQTTPPQRIVQPEDLGHAPGPAGPLADVQRQPLGGQASGQAHPQEGRVPATPLQLEGGMGILGHGFHREAADLFQRATPHQCTGTAEEGRIPVVIALLHRPIEQLPFVGDVRPGDEIALERIRGIEVVRRL